MKYGILLGVVMSFVGLGAGAAQGQEIVHALSGTAQKIDPQSKTLQVTTNDGSEGTFSFPSSTSKTSVDFERDVQDRTTPVRNFSKLHTQVIVFYYGNGDVRTAVGVQDLGPGPFGTVEGTVTSFDKHHQSITVRDSSGKKHTFQIDPKAMADSASGAVPANRLSASNGDTVRVIAVKGPGPEKALFIRD